jgi:hypothetical protein
MYPCTCVLVHTHVCVCVHTHTYTHTHTHSSVQLDQILFGNWEEDEGNEMQEEMKEEEDGSEGEAGGGGERGEGGGGGGEKTAQRTPHGVRDASQPHACVHASKSQNGLTRSLARGFDTHACSPSSAVLVEAFDRVMLDVMLYP